jgi:hypothetical protein
MKRSLHIGINDYPGTGNDLSGYVNDAVVECSDTGSTLDLVGVMRSCEKLIRHRVLDVSRAVTNFQAADA